MEKYHLFCWTTASREPSSVAPIRRNQGATSDPVRVHQRLHLRRGEGKLHIGRAQRAMAVALVESTGPVKNGEIATLAGSTAIFCHFAESSDEARNTGEDLGGEVYD